MENKTLLRIVESNGNILNKKINRRTFAAGAMALVGVSVAGCNFRSSGSPSSGDHIIVVDGDGKVKGEVAIPADTPTAQPTETLTNFDTSKLSPADPDRFKGRETSDPERFRQIVENGLGQNLVKEFQITKDQIGGWGVMSTFDDEQRVATEYATCAATRIEALLNLGCTGSQVVPYLVSGRGGYVSDMSEKYDMPAVRGLYGLEGNSTGTSTQQSPALPLTASDIEGMLPYEMLHKAHQAVLGDYMREVAVTGDINQSIRVRLIDAACGSNFGTKGGDIIATLSVSRIRGRSTQTNDLNENSEIIGRAFFSVDPTASDGILKSYLSAGLLHGEDNYTVFEKIAEILG